MSNFEKIVERVLCFDYLPNKGEWSLCDDNGWTIAHVYASRKKLPSSFTEFDLADHKGYTVAQHAAANNTLPNHFSDWGKLGDARKDIAFLAGQSERRNNLAENARKSQAISPERRKAESDLLSSFSRMLKESEPQHKRRI